MTEAMLVTILAEAQAKGDKDAERTLPDGRRITLYAAHDGVPLTVTKVEGVKLVGGGVVKARNDKGESFLLSLEDLFAAAIDGGGSGGSTGRKAGFLG